MKMYKLLYIILLFIMISTVVSCKNTTDSSITTTITSETTATLKTYEPADFFVYSPYTVIHYSGTGNEFAEFSSYVEYIKDDLIQIRYTNPGTSSVSVYKIGQDAVTRIFFEGEIYYRHDFMTKNDTDEIIIKSPIQKGNTWELQDGTVRTITAVDIEIELGTGTYKAIEITTKAASSTLKDYYALDMGLIKRVFTTDEAPGEEIISELLSITGDVPFIQYFTVWYPSLDDNIYIPDNKILELRTNDDVIKALEAAMKSDHQERNLAAIVPVAAIINKIDPFYAKDVMSVDFSTEYVTDMNAGSQYESMLLYAAAKTLGGYYQHSKVIITIDDKNYSSGHIAYEDGEYLVIEP